MPKWIRIEVVSEGEKAPRSAKPAPSGPRLWPWLLAAGLGLVLILTVVGVWFARSRQTTTATGGMALPLVSTPVTSSTGPVDREAPETAGVSKPQFRPLSADILRRLESDRPVAIVNGEPITEGMLEREVAIGRVLFPLLQGIPVDDSPATLERMRSDLLSSLIDERLLVQEAQKAGIAVSDAEVEARLSDTLSRIKLSEEELVELLTAVGVTLDDLRASLRSTMLAERFVKETPPPVSTAGKSPAEAWLAKLQQEADIQILTGEEKSRTVKIGQPAPPFTLRSPDGEVIRLKDFVGQPLLINFWATWCPPCRFEMPLLQDTYEKYRDQGLVVLGVDVQEGPELVKPFLEQYGLTFPVALDRSGAVSSAYRVMGLPTTVFVDRDGVVVDIHRGALIEQTLQGYLDKILTP